MWQIGLIFEYFDITKFVYQYFVMKIHDTVNEKFNSPILVCSIKNIKCSRKLYIYL